MVCVHSLSQEYLLGWKYYMFKTFQNYQSTIKVWLSLRKIFQLTKSLKSRDLVCPLFSLLKCSYLTQLSKLYLLQWKSCIRCWKFPSHSSEKNLKNSLLFSLVFISGKIHFIEHKSGRHFPCKRKINFSLLRGRMRRERWTIFNPLIPRSDWLLPKISIHHHANRYWETSNFWGSCYLDLKLNSPNWFTRKCVATREKN